MRITVAVTITTGDDSPTVVHEVFNLEREALSAATVGLRLDEAKELLAAIQERMVTEQARVALAERAACPECGAAHRHKDTRAIVLRSLFGTLRVDSPRWWHCSCSTHQARTFSPLAEQLPDRVTPELLYLEAKFAGLASYGLSTKLLAELLPLGRPLQPAVLRRQVQTVAQRLEDELGKEQPGFIKTCPRDLEKMPRPDMPITVGLDGGFVHSAHQRSRRDGWFEVIAGKSIPTEGRSRCFGFVQTYDEKPKRRLYQLLHSQGLTDNQAITFLTDGGDDVRDLPLELNPQAEYFLDWFHISMRLTVLGQMAKAPASAELIEKRGMWCEELEDDDLRGLQEELEGVPHKLERLKWFLWHGSVFRALQILDELVFDLELIAKAGPAYAKLYQAIREFKGYIAANSACIPNYGELHRAGERISTGFAESTINQLVAKRMVKRQQMRWTPRGAHLLLQVRTRVLDDTLAEDFHRWHPDFTHTPPRLEELGIAS